MKFTGSMPRTSYSETTSTRLRRKRRTDVKLERRLAYYEAC
jgi:hypothetical protein